MRCYFEFTSKNPSKNYEMKHLLNVTLHNYGRLHGEKRWKCEIEKGTNIDALELLNSNKTNVLYHCVLVNNHAIVVFDNWIFDPTLTKAVPCNEKHLRFSAQSDDLEDSKNLVLVLYKYSWV